MALLLSWQLFLQLREFYLSKHFPKLQDVMGYSHSTYMLWTIAILYSFYLMAIIFENCVNTKKSISMILSLNSKAQHTFGVIYGCVAFMLVLYVQITILGYKSWIDNVNVSRKMLWLLHYGNKTISYCLNLSYIHTRCSQNVWYIKMIFVLSITR